MLVYIRGRKDTTQENEIRFLDFSPILSNESKVLLDKEISKPCNVRFSKDKEITRIVCQCK